MHWSEAAYWELVAVAGMRLLIVLLAFAALLSLKRTDAVVLKARIYMNHKKVLTGLAFLGIAMIIFFIQAAFELIYLQFWGEDLPLEVTGLLFIAAAAALIKGFHSWYSLSKASDELSSIQGRST